MQEENTRRNNRRTGTVEVPGDDEIKTKPPTVQQQVIEATPAPKGDGFAEQVAEETLKGNVVHAHHSSKPKVGDRWAGMVLTKHGWAVEDLGE